MITLKDYRLEIIREFTKEQFLLHIELINDIFSENDFDKTNINVILENYLKLIKDIYEKYQKGTKEFQLSRSQVMLYDLIAELARLCYKHSYATSRLNDWEEEC